MASVAAVASSLKHQCWNPRKSNFFPSFDAVIELDRPVIRPFKVLTGRLKLNTSKLIRFNGGLRVQIDANVKLRFQSKLDNRVTTNWAVESIFQDAPEADDGNYVLSPIRQQLLGDESDIDQKFAMEPGSYTYPFELHMSGEPLPAPFSSLFGNLQFYVAAYIGSPYCYVQAAEVQVGFGGFNDLTQSPTAMNPLSFSSHLHESVFSSKPLVTFTLTSTQTGYHPGDQIHFTLTIDNPKRREIKTVSVVLLRKAIYNASGATKTTTAVLDTFEIDNTGESEKSSIQSSNSDKQVMYMGTLCVPKPCIPSYSGKKIYTNSYFLQYEVKVQGHPGLGKGQSEIILGTTKPSAAMFASRHENIRRSSAACPTSNREEEPFEPAFVPQQRQRSNSICARSGSHHPVIMHLNNHSSRPPSATPTYGPSRTISMMSLKDNLF